jgi:transposase
MSQGASGLRITSSQRQRLEAVARHPSTPQRIALRARIVLGAAAGVPNQRLARELETSLPTVLKWRRRWEAEGLSGVLEDRFRVGRPKQISEEEEAAVIEATLRTTPPQATHWSVRSMARAQGLSPATIQRIWTAYGLQPHRVEAFKFSADPQFVYKVRDIVGLYMDPPEQALVLSIDEKSQIQALDRTQPLLPLRPGLPARQTHDYVRHGTTTLFAALNVLTGHVIGACQSRHRHQEFLKFLERVDQSVAPDLEVHLVLDNYGTHKHPAVRTWFAGHARYHVHFTPTSASWLNQIERWFSEITRKRIRRGTFRSLQALVRAIHAYIRESNKTARPFTWTAAATTIVRKVQKAKETSETTH